MKRNASSFFAMTVTAALACAGGAAAAPVTENEIYGDEYDDTTLSSTSDTLTVTGTGDSSQPANFFAILFTQGTSSAAGGDPVTNWFELPDQGNYAYTFTSTAGDYSITNAGFFLSPTQIPLDQLNINDEPPFASQWTPFTGFTPDIESGRSANVEVPGATEQVPEPGVLALLATGFGGLAWLRRRRKAGLARG